MTKKALIAATVFAAILAGCPNKPKPDGGDASVTAKNAAGGDSGGAIVSNLDDAPANAAHGKELIAQYQCNRCHSGAEQQKPPENKD